MTDEDRDRAKAELEKLVADGYSLLGQNRTEEAALVAEKVLEESPSFAEALSLLGMCHERNHDTLAALACYERVVELRPDSALDKIKVQQLRNQIARGAKEDRPNRAVALIGAVAAVLLVGSVGGIVATMVARPASAATTPSEQPTGNSIAGAPFTRQDPIAEKQAAPTETVTPADQTQPKTDVGSTNPGIRHQLGGIGGPSLPDPSKVARNDEGEGNVPVVLDGIKVEQEKAQGGGTNTDEPKPEGSGRTAEAAPPVDPEAGIEIKVHKNTSLGGSEPANSGEQSLTVLLKSAREQYMLGRFSSAAAMYERALGAGGDAGSINQRLGQCYERMGKTSEAIAAYSRAERALESRGSKAALEAVRQALQNLRGN